MPARPAIAHAILVKMLVEASIFREWVLNVGRRNAKTRVAHLLCEFAVRLEAIGLAGDSLDMHRRGFHSLPRPPHQ